MLTEERFSIILGILEKNKRASAAQLMEATHSSPSTIRRDLSQLEEMGKLSRVHGGAVLRENRFTSTEDRIISRREKNAPEKRRIAAAAARLVSPGDFVYIDAGTTTEKMLEELDTADVRVVTNAISHAKTLAEKGYEVSLIGGSFKDVTEAIVGEEAVEFIQRYNFTKGFFGTNGIDDRGRLNTPDSREAAIKKAAMAQCRECLILADPSKFDVLTSVNFGNLKGNTLITTKEAVLPELPASTRIIRV